MIIRWWLENLCMYVCVQNILNVMILPRSGIMPHEYRKNKLWTTAISIRMNGRQWRRYGNVSIHFVKSLSSLKIPMRCTMHDITTIVRNYSVLQMCMSDVCIAQRILDIPKYVLRKNNPFCCTCETLCWDLLVSPEWRQPEKTSRL